MQSLPSIQPLQERQLATMNRLNDYAQEAIAEYSKEVAGGGEPHYPQWAADILDVLLLILNQRNFS